MNRWGKWGRSLSRPLSVVLLIGSLSAAGCGKQKDVAETSKPDTAQTTPGATTPTTTAGKTDTEPVTRDRLHMSFVDATRNSDNPPGMEERPPDVTMTQKATFKILKDVQQQWDKIRFTRNGRPIRYTATIETSQGSIEIELKPDVAPNHVRNFIALAQAGYYEQLLFDRIRHEESTAADDPSPLKLDLIEGGCPVGSGDPASGSIGYWLKPEFTDKEHHLEGTLGACHGFEPDTAGTRFYITLSKASYLDGNFTVFGRVTSGLDVVRKIAQQPTIVDATATDSSRRPEKPIVIKKVTIHTDAATGA